MATTPIQRVSLFIHLRGRLTTGLRQVLRPNAVMARIRSVKAGAERALAMVGLGVGFERDLDQVI